MVNNGLEERRSLFDIRSRDHEETKNRKKGKE